MGLGLEFVNYKDELAVPFHPLKKCNVTGRKGQVPSRLGSSLTSPLGHQLPVAMTTEWVQAGDFFPGQVTLHLTAGLADHPARR